MRLNFNIVSIFYIFTIFILFFCSRFLFAFENNIPLSSIDTKAEYVIAVDDLTGQVIFEKNSHEHMKPASMSKLMSLYIVFSAIDKGSINLDDYFTVSREAWLRKGSTMFLEIGEKIKVIDLIKGAIIVSGNDATIALAEGVAGSQDLFVLQMNEIAKKMGLKDSNFTNVTGWPDENHYMSAVDITNLSRKIWHEFPQYHYIYKEKGLTHNSIYQPNSNRKSLRTSSSITVDGLKTGSSEETGYGVSLVAENNKGRRVFVVFQGSKNSESRALESKNLINYSLNMFDTRTLFEEGELIFSVNLIGAKDKYLNMYANDSINILYQSYKEGFPKVDLNYKDNLKAPIKKGDYLGSLKIKYSEDNIIKKDFYAEKDVLKAGFVQRIFKKVFMNN